MLKSSRYFIILSLFFAVTAHADPITDAALLKYAIDQMNALKNQYKLLNETYESSKSQLKAIKDLKTFNSGHYGFGDLNNGIDNLIARQWSPSTWDDALKKIAGGNPSRYNDLLKAYENQYPSLDKSIFLKGGSEKRLAQYQQNRAVNQVVSVQATYAYNEINQHLKAIHELSSLIEQTKNTKSAIDLNSRLLAELAYIQTENLKLQSLVGQQLASAEAGNIVTDSEAAKFNKLPDE